MAYAIETFPGGEIVVQLLPGPPPDIGHHILVDGARWRVLDVEHRVAPEFRGERSVQVFALVELEPRTKARARG